MSTKFNRKHCLGHLLKFQAQNSPEVVVNGRVYNCEESLKRRIPPGKYTLRITGGGAASRREVVLGVIINSNTSDSALKRIAIDPRRNYPTMYGGGKSRKRYQKSYR